MKAKYKNITIPFKVYNPKRNETIYIYKDKEYKDMNKLFNKFLGSYLTYHYEVKEKLCTVHNLSDVINALLKNKDTFIIPRKYKNEYSTREYKYITNLQDKLKNKKLTLYYDNKYKLKFSLREYKQYKADKEARKLYGNLTTPKKVHSNVYDNDLYAINGSYYESIYYALNEVNDEVISYEFGGSKRPNSRSFVEIHNFDEVISNIFTNYDKFVIREHQLEFYSKQELEFINKLLDKLKEMNFKVPERSSFELLNNEYKYYSDNQNRFQLFLTNLRYQKEEKKEQEERLKNHKI